MGRGCLLACGRAVTECCWRLAEKGGLTVELTPASLWSPGSEDVDALGFNIDHDFFGIMSVVY
jgi:hypothetical protein